MRDQNAAPLNEPISDYRLPKTVTPKRYDIRLAPDLKAFTFDGEEKIEVAVNQATADVLLNALDLEIGAVTAERDGKSIAGKATLNEKLERAHLKFSEPLTPGKWTLKIAFKGILNDKLHGFYRSQYKDTAGKSHTVAATQFESTDARRSFPCWDEPELKASYKMTLAIDESLVAVSNGGIESERKLGGGKKEIVFKETIVMSTYLVAVIVGEFEATPPVDAGTPLRIVHVPGKAGLTPWAKQIGAFSVRFFADYYGIGYPGDKLDLIAIPDFASGAMENLGAITFRETALLADEKAASRAELERIADVVAHEIAHMWFGDLVTMRWWNGIWLNEAFATFMEMLAVDAWKPSWKRWESFGLSRAGAMVIDGLRSTRSIEFPVNSPEDCRAMFDTLTYEKGASVLRMLEQYLKPEVFREGIRRYLKKHQFNNTETSDLWDALEDASREPVRKVMDSWIFQPGFPMVDAKLAADGRRIVLSQRRFFYLPETNNQTWQVPVMIRAKTAKGVSTHRALLTGNQVEVELPDKPEWVLLNEGGHGYYRVHYSPELLAALAKNLDALEPIERFGLVSDTWAAAVAGMAPFSEFLKLARLFTGETDLNVWRALINPFNYLDLIVAEADRPALSAALRAIVGPAHQRLGWEAKPGDSELVRQLRGTIIGALGTLGGDPDVQSRARELYARFESEPASADRDLMPALVGILAYTGDSARYEDFKKRFKSPRTPQEEQRYLFSLAGFRDLGLLKKTMEMTLDGQVRTQNAPYLLHSLLLNPVSRYQAWDFMRSHWDEIVSKYPDSALPRMCEAIVALVDREDEAKKFFAEHRVRIGAKLIDQHLERLSVAVLFRKREGAALGAALKG
ncbi:MAG TPA: M1 family metallopeptidase [Candidatus Binataceae bacterium]|nr:M1 family metallopeptidase [Candidatus Binataceae bacterium]